jgi:acyl-CoA synthetase (AMP-forming)/AMP-acid ligase II
MTMAEGAVAHGFSLAALFDRSTRLFAERPAVVSSDVTLTYAELGARTDRLAASLERRGITRGDRVAVLSTTRPEYIEIYVAAAKLGVTVVGLNYRLHPTELSACLQLTEPTVLFVSPDSLPLLASLLDATAGMEVVELGSSYAELVDAPLESRPTWDPRADDIHSVVFTSGTTGKPKGAMISQGAAAIRALRVAHWYDLGPEDGMVGWLPLYHTSVETVTATLLSGGRWATLERADVEEMYEQIERHRLTWIPLLPGVFTDFLDNPARGRHDLSTLRFGFGYANMMPQAVKEFTAKFDAYYWDAYGQTETSFLVAHGRIDPGDEPSFRKLPTPLLDIRIVDEDMQRVPPEVPGECVVRGPSVMTGYCDDDAATDEVFRGGWLHTGDVLVEHEDGTLSFVDRVKYLIKTGGENVYPAEVEQVICEHAAVREACVVSVQDDRWGEAIKAVVVLHPTESMPAAAIQQWCRERLAHYKCPRFVQFATAEELPRSITGKILRNELAAMPSEFGES